MLGTVFIRHYQGEEWLCDSKQDIFKNHEEALRRAEEHRSYGYKAKVVPVGGASKPRYAVYRSRSYSKV